MHPVARADARIVSLVPSLTELLFVLGLGDQVVGRTGFCIHPRDAVRRVPKVGGTKDVALDKVLALAPTHLVVNIDENRRETVDALAAEVAHVIVTHPLAPDDNLQLYRMFGTIFGRTAEAEALAARYAATRDALLDAVGHSCPRRKRALPDLAQAVVHGGAIDLCVGDAGLWRAGERCRRFLRRAIRRSTMMRRRGARPNASCSRPSLMHSARKTQARSPSMLASRGQPMPVTLIDGEMTSWYGARAVAGLEYLAQMRRAWQGLKKKGRMGGLFRAPATTQSGTRTPTVTAWKLPSSLDAVALTLAKPMSLLPRSALAPTSNSA